MRFLWVALTMTLSGVLSSPGTTNTLSIPYIVESKLQRRADFGNEEGNTQPSRAEDELEEVQVIDDLAVQELESDDGSGKGEDVYVLYQGNGTTDDGWPDIEDWVSFEDMWDANLDIMSSSCSRVYLTTDNTEDELSDLQASIDTLASESLLDHRFILAVVLQESGGCVRVPTSNFEIRNPGLMQSHNGIFSCNELGEVSQPCSIEMIEGMIEDGVKGTSDGDGLVQCLNDSERDDVSAFYRAARCYNSGSVADSGALEDGGATHCYASDVANRLMGWTEAPHACWL